MADLRTLHPALVPWARWIYAVGKQQDGRLVVTSARRSPKKQAELCWKWRIGQSKIPAACTYSLHQEGLAFDMARLGIPALGDPLLAWLGAVWEHYGGSHGGERDPVHFQPRM